MNMVKKVALLMAVVAAVAIFVVFDLDQYIEVESFQAWVADQPLQAGMGFALLYLVVASLSLPGAGALSLVAGAVFGLWYGVLIVSFASSAGATIAMTISRALLQDWVQKRFFAAFERVNSGVKRDGALYLFSLRLIPPIPFFVINLVFGLTKIRPLTFYLVSQLGMLPATLLFVNAGASLGRVETLSFLDIFSPEIILSFAALIAFPFLIKFMLKRSRFAPESKEE